MSPKPVLSLCLAAILLGAPSGDALFRRAATAEQNGDWDTAYENYRKASNADRANLAFRIALERARFQCAQFHLDRGRRIRSTGELEKSLAEFTRALDLDPASQAAIQEITRTRAMLARAESVKQSTGKELSAQEKALTPADQARREAGETAARMQPPPELQPLNPAPLRIRILNQSPRVMFETIGKSAGINVLFDPDYQPGKNSSLELMDSTLAQSLEYVSLLSRSFYRVLSPNTIFVANDLPNKRRDYEEYVTRVFYLTNINTVQELQEIITAVRTVAELQRVAQFSTQYAIAVRGEADRVALAQRLITSLDKPRPEVVVDILVLEASKVFSRQVTAAIASTGLNLALTPAPRTSVQANSTTSSSSTTTTSTTVALSSLRHLASADFAVSLPGAILQAALSDTGTRVLQSPQLRSIDNMKATLRIGDRQPTATGSYSGVTSGSVSALVNTQFQYIDVGVNVDLVPRVHENGDVSLHIELEISSVTGHVSLGGIEEPVIGQRKVMHDIRMREGEVGLLGGLANSSESKTFTGIPGLAQLPLVGKLFSGQSVERFSSDFLIALIPHIVRAPAAREEDQRPVATGAATAIHLNYKQ